MPWNKQQHRLFEAAEHSPTITKQKGISQSQATKLAHEGVKADNAENSASQMKWNAKMHTLLGK